MSYSSVMKEKSRTIQFGFHMTLDFYGCPLEKLNDLELCYQVLDNLPKLLGMKMLTAPQVIMADGNLETQKKDPGGITGFIIIAESHISLHTFARRGFVSFDIYSCKEFDYKNAEEYLAMTFNPQDVEIHTIDRGTRYPSSNIY